VARELADGDMATAEADYHPHSIAEAIRRDICEGQIVQIVGRPRGVNRTAENPVDIFILTDCPLPLPVDVLVPADVFDPTPAGRMMAAAGVALSNAADASEVFKSFWKTRETAKKAFQRAAERLGTESPIYINGTLSPTSADSETKGGFVSSGGIFPYSGNGGGFARVEYQRTGGGKSVSEAVFDITRVSDPRGWLTAKFGDLVDYQLCEVTPSKRKRPPQPMVQPEPELEHVQATLDVVQESNVIVVSANVVWPSPPMADTRRTGWTPSPPPPSVLEQMPRAIPWGGDD
jgi:putative DNA primase/helicase